MRRPPLLTRLLRARGRGRASVVASITAPADPGQQAEWKRAGLDLIEVRNDLARTPLPLAAWRGDAEAVLPMLFTSRSVPQGGQDRRLAKTRLRQLHTAGSLFDAIDAELPMPPDGLRELLDRCREQSCTTVVSFHDHQGIPPRDTLERILARALETGADIVKIAARVDTPQALGTLAAFMGEHSRENLAVLGMGRHGRLSRALLPTLGSLFTFAHVGAPTAEGQMSLEKTRRLCALVQKLSR